MRISASRISTAITAAPRRATIPPPRGKARAPIASCCAPPWDSSSRRGAMSSAAAMPRHGRSPPTGAIVILELFNYVAHYGLRRRRAPDGRLEPLGAAHSWNVARRVDNALLFNGGRHAHHHRRPALPWQHLRLAAQTPLLPCGLAGSILIALIPPLWRRIMDPKVDYWMASPAPVSGRPDLRRGRRQDQRFRYHANRS